MITYFYIYTSIYNYLMTTSVTATKHMSSAANKLLTHGVSLIRISTVVNVLTVCVTYLALDCFFPTIKTHGTIWKPLVFLVTY